MGDTNCSSEPIDCTGKPDGWSPLCNCCQHCTLCLNERPFLHVRNPSPAFWIFQSDESLSLLFFHRFVFLFFFFAKNCGRGYFFLLADSPSCLPDSDANSVELCNRDRSRVVSPPPATSPPAAKSLTDLASGAGNVTSDCHPSKPDGFTYARSESCSQTFQRCYNGQSYPMVR